MNKPIISETAALYGPFPAKRLAGPQEAVSERVDVLMEDGWRIVPHSSEVNGDCVIVRVYQVDVRREERAA